MAKQDQTFQSRGYDNGGCDVTSANTTAWVTCYTVPADDCNIKGLAGVSNDTAAVNLRIGIDNGGTGATIRQIGCVNVPAGSGTNGTARSVDLMNALDMPHLPVDRNGKRIIPMKGGDKLVVAALATMTSGKTLTATPYPEFF